MKIKVSSTGMHLVSNADLKAMGFSNPDAVNVYGTGGRMVREALAEDMPDDPPLFPPSGPPKGGWVFSTANVSWASGGGGGESLILI